MFCSGVGLKFKGGHFGIVNDFTFFLHEGTYSPMICGPLKYHPVKGLGFSLHRIPVSWCGVHQFLLFC